MNKTSDPVETKIAPSKAEQLSHLRDWNTTRLGKLDSYLIHVPVMVFSWIFMYWLQRTKIYHKKRLNQLKLPTVILPNHVSMLDDFFLGPPVLFPKMALRYDLLPYHAPEEKNFFKGKILSYFMRKLKCVPLTRGAGFNQPGMLRLTELAMQGNLIWVYPEGGRTRTGQVNRGKAGIGIMLYRSRAQAIPLYHYGLHEVLPIGKKFPRFFRRIRIIIGNPIPLDDLFELPDEPKTWQAIADRVTDAIRDLRNELETLDPHSKFAAPSTSASEASN